jgi:hypothetical protein
LLGGAELGLEGDAERINIQGQQAVRIEALRISARINSAACSAPLMS